MKRKIQAISVTLIFFTFSVIFIACKKTNSNGGDYFLKFKANTSTINYTNQSGLYYTAVQTGSSHLILITGFNNASSNISLQVFSNAPITTGSYSGYSISTGTPIGVIVGYLDEGSGQLFNSAGAVTDANITITEINNSHIKGTFSGTLKKSGLADIAITDGEFYVKKNG